MFQPHHYGVREVSKPPENKWISPDLWVCRQHLTSVKHPFSMPDCMYSNCNGKRPDLSERPQYGGVGGEVISKPTPPPKVSKSTLKRRGRVPPPEELQPYLDDGFDEAEAIRLRRRTATYRLVCSFCSQPNWRRPKDTVKGGSYKCCGCGKLVPIEESA